jgi:predicted acylesterase/phospholipase RssA
VTVSFRSAARPGVALSGGGSKGDFEVGVLRYLADHGISPKIVTGTSVGAINGAKLAEGPASLTELEGLWLDLRVNGDMWEPEEWVTELAALQRETLGEWAGAIAGHVLTGFVFWPDWLDRASKLNQVLRVLDAAPDARSIFNLQPIYDKLQSATGVDPAKVAASGVALRLAVVSLETGRLRFIDEHGRFLDTGDAVDLHLAVLASAAIPGIFPPVRLPGTAGAPENYVDGGVRELVPIAAALEAGADQVVAVLTRPTAGADVAPSFDEAPALAVVDRSVNAILLDEILQGDIQGPWNGIVYVVAPGVEPHGSLFVDRGMVRISMAYGYMRADDVLHLAWPNPDARTLARRAALTEEIFRLRTEIWELEYKVSSKAHLKTIVTRLPREESETLPSTEALAKVRDSKYRLRELAQERLDLGGALSNDVNSWWSDWEAHWWDPDSYIASPWRRFVVRDRVLAAMDPPAEVVVPEPIVRRVGVLLEDGNLHVKEGALDAGWIWQSHPVRSFALEGDRIGALLEDGNLHVKEGPIDAGWTWQSHPVRSFALEGDRIGVLLEDGNLHVKEGPLDAGWIWQSHPVRSFSFEGDRIGMLLEDGNLHVKEGPLGAGWTWQSHPVRAFALEGDRIGVLLEDSTVQVKEGALDAGWTWERHPVRAFALAGDRIGVLLEDGNLEVKEGALDAGWIWQSHPVRSFALAGDRIGVLLEDGNLHVKEGELDAGWTWESHPVRSFGLSARP